MSAPVEVLQMTPGQWALVPGNPRQRNTEDRVKRAKHLLTPVEDHRVVKMALLPDGAQVKIDGHTRGLFWQQHPELAPAELLVVVFRCAEPTEALQLYDACDSQAAVESANDKVFGAFREAEYQPVSSFMEAGRIAAALRWAYSLEMHVSMRDVSVHQMVHHWLPELTWIDGLIPNAAWFSTPVLGAALLTLRKHGVVERPPGVFRL